MESQTSFELHSVTIIYPRNQTKNGFAATTNPMNFFVGRSINTTPDGVHSERRRGERHYRTRTPMSMYLLAPLLSMVVCSCKEEPSKVLLVIVGYATAYTTVTQRSKLIYEADGRGNAGSAQSLSLPNIQFPQPNSLLKE